MMLIPRGNYGFNLSDGFFNDPFFTGSTEKNSNDRKLPAMRIDTTEKDGNYIIEIGLPGFKKKDIKAELKDGYLTISTEHDASSESKGDKGTVIHGEHCTSSCKRAFFVGRHTGQEDIKASSENGIPKPQVPKGAPKVEGTSRYIDIL